jgi:hypothetical protein
MFLLATCISILFLLFKFFEMRFIEKETKPLKYLIRDALIVYFSVLSGSVLLDQLKPVLFEGTGELPSQPPVFVGEPSF